MWWNGTETGLCMWENEIDRRLPTFCWDFGPAFLEFGKPSKHLNPAIETLEKGLKCV